MSALARCTICGVLDHAQDHVEVAISRVEYEEVEEFGCTKQVIVHTWIHPECRPGTEYDRRKSGVSDRRRT